MLSTSTRICAIAALSASLHVAANGDAVAQGAARPDVIKLVRMVGMGVGIGKQCRLVYSPLSSGFKRLLARNEFTAAQKDALRRVYQDGISAAEVAVDGPAACASARRIWKDQVETLTLSMVGIR